MVFSVCRINNFIRHTGGIEKRPSIRGNRFAQGLFHMPLPLEGGRASVEIGSLKASSTCRTESLLGLRQSRINTRTIFIFKPCQRVKVGRSLALHAPTRLPYYTEHLFCLWIGNYFWHRWRALPFRCRFWKACVCGCIDIERATDCNTI